MFIDVQGRLEGLSLNKLFTIPMRFGDSDVFLQADREISYLTTYLQHPANKACLLFVVV